jgi:putative OPT family oligopeptide transporter
MVDTPAKPEATRIELTIRGLILGVLICVVLTAANVYMGLRVALTFASSIPAAVISMAVLRAFKNSTIWENNIVQTVASAAGTLSSVIFVLPGLIMVGWWSHFNFLDSFLICVVGGVLGVMYTIPLRRALVTNSDLPYPEGVAAAEVLKVGSGAAHGATEEGNAVETGSAGLKTMIAGSAVSALFPLGIGAKFFSDGFNKFWRLSPTAGTGIGGSYSLALIGAGHLMGAVVGVSMLVGIIIAWGGFVPYFLTQHPISGDLAAAATAVFKSKVKLIGAGTIAASSIWTLGKLVMPVWRGLVSAAKASSQSAKGGSASLPRTERDMPIAIVGLIALVCVVPIAWMLYAFLHLPRSAPLLPMLTPLIIAGVVYIAIVGLAVSAVCGYMAGLIGSSNSPVSGLAILAVLGATLMLNGIAGAVVGSSDALVAFSLFVTAILLTVATIANNNLQDLKTGQLVDATPWKQQVALLVGVVAGALVIPPVCDLLFNTYGIDGVISHPLKMGAPLVAPQANLISTIARGVIKGDLDWPLLFTGMGVGVVLVIIDEVLRKVTKGKMGLPPLGAALAMYLPTAVTTPVVLGSFIGWGYDKLVGRKPWGKAAKQLGVLLASGFIVGESLIYVVIAGMTSATGLTEPFAIFGTDPTHGNAELVGASAFAVVTAVLYFWIQGMAKKNNPAKA